MFDIKRYNLEYNGIGCGDDLSLIERPDGEYVEYEIIKFLVWELVKMANKADLSLEEIGIKEDAYKFCGIDKKTYNG